MREESGARKRLRAPGWDDQAISLVIRNSGFISKLLNTGRSRSVL
jgi:hypothetical protein